MSENPVQRRPHSRLPDSLALPSGADEDASAASYDKAILTVSVPVTEAKSAENHVKAVSAS